MTEQKTIRLGITVNKSNATINSENEVLVRFARSYFTNKKEFRTKQEKLLPTRVWRNGGRSTKLNIWNSIKHLWFIEHSEL